MAITILSKDRRLPFECELPSYLDAHQREGVKWILTRHASYLAQCPGSGKTCQAITAAIMTPGHGPSLFIVPPTLTANWAREIRKWCAQWPKWSWLYPSIATVRDSARQSDVNWGAEWIIVPDSMLTKPWVQKGITDRQPQFIAIDEASRFKEITAHRSRVLYGGAHQGKLYPGLVYHSAHVVMLDGSPMPNGRAMELWAPTLHLAPESIGHMNYYEFGMRYGAARMNSYGKWEFKGTTNHEELRERLTKSFMHVVTEEELSHPERLRSLILMNRDARSAEQKHWEAKAVIRVDDILSEDDSQGDLARFRRELGVRKVPWVAEYLNERLSRKSESVLLFAWHREVVTELGNRFPKARLILGGTNERDRETFIRQFQKGQIPMLIMNIAAASRGHNLQRADRVVFAEYSWSDEMNRQAEKRASRMGSDKLSVPCSYIVCPNSMDEMILRAVMRKARSVKRVIG